MKWRHLKEYLIFTRKERTGIFVLIILIAIIYFIPEVMPDKKLYYLNKGADTLFQIVEARNKLNHKEVKDSSSNYKEISASDHLKLFTFDPNTLPESGWKSLGLREKTIRTIINFRLKGGRFRNASDIRKIYGLQKHQADQLIPYVRINDPDHRSRDVQGDVKSSSSKSFGKTKISIQPIEINAADSIQLIALPGIGARLASRVLAFRERLGGFYSINQISETYGLTDSVFLLIKPLLLCDATKLKGININTIDLSDLKNHPYIRWNLANAIIRYRQQHGKFSSVRDLLKIEIITDETYNKIAPYVVTE